MNLYSFSVLCFSFGVTLIAILTLMKRRDQIAVRFLMFSIAVCGWGYLFSIWSSQQYPVQDALKIARFSYAFVAFIPTTWLHFVFEFIEKKEPFKHFYLLNYLLSLAFMFSCATPWMIAEMAPFLDFVYMPKGGVVHHFHVVHFFGLIVFGLLCLIKKYIAAEGYEKDQIRYFVLGAVIGFTLGGSIYVTYYRIPLPLYHLVFLPLYPILTGIALIRYGLFDVQQIADAFQREKLAAIGTIAASLNHELRNPLYVASGRIESYLDNVKRGLYPTSEDRQQNAEKVLETASAHLRRGMEILQRFSDFAKPFNAGREKEKIILNEAVHNVFELVSNEFKMQKIELDYQPADGLCIHANYRQIEEIFFNLIINACHAMEENGGRLSIKAAQPNGKVIVDISDTGSGIPQENLRRIFEPFYSTKGKKGSGLGLYITKQLVERNGGTISVKSRPGAGTKFTLAFPAK